MDKFSYRGDWSLDLEVVSFHGGDTGGVDKGGMISIFGFVLKNNLCPPQPKKYIVLSLLWYQVSS
jgi:hypothetical protein